MDKKQHHGFLMGVVTGAVCTMLLTTKKGREVVKDLAKNNIDIPEDWKNVLAEIAQSLDDYTEEDEGIVEAKMEKKEEKKQENTTNPIKKIAQSTRRFFIRKKK